MEDPSQGDPRRYLKQLCANNTMNSLCVDCTKKKSTHVNTTFGTFICSECSSTHGKVFGNVHVIRELFFKYWHVDMVNTCRLGGNAAFFEHMSAYKQEQALIPKKYQSQAATLYKNLLRKKVKGDNDDQD